MSKLSDIEHHVNQLSGSAFQTLCDTYLKKSNFPELEYHPYGRKTGEDKTIKGNPDTYFIDQNGQYIFVMYTTTQQDLLSKITGDLNKCFDIEKNGGISTNKIIEIVYCYTNGRLSVGDRDILGNICLQNDTFFKMLSTAEISLDLLNNFPTIIRDQLGISIDTGQITDAKTFVEEHDANSLSAPLNNEFLFREAELKQITSDFDYHRPVIITGPAGTGKTKLALEATSRYYQSHKDYKLFCIKSKNLGSTAFFNDLTSSTESQGNYVFFIDDANQLPETHLVLDYINKHPNSNLIVTVRNYVLGQVANEIQKYQQPDLIRLRSFNRDQIGQLIDSTYHINQQSEFVDYVYSTYNGNPRLAMFASKLMLQQQDFSDIHNTSELYYRYYQDSIDEILSTSKTAPISAGIISFLKNIRLDHLAILNELFACFDLSQANFLNDLTKFESQELVEIHRGKTNDSLAGAKISDESFSDYLVKYLFIDQRRLALDKMIELSFFKLKDKTIAACSALKRIFSDSQTASYLERVVNQLWDKLEKDRTRDKESEKRFESFFDAFYILRPTETLSELQNRISASPTVAFDTSSIDFNNKVRNESIDNKIIDKLGAFTNSSDTQAAIELALGYFKKRPGLLMEFYFLFTKRFGINDYSYRNGFATQKTVIRALEKLSQKEPTVNNLFLVTKVFAYYLSFTYETIQSDPVNKNTINIQTFTIIEGSNIREIRNLIWRFLLDQYQSSPKNHSEIEEILYSYGNRLPSESRNVIKNDYQQLGVFFQNLFDPDCLYHCVIAEHIHQLLAAKKIEDTGYLDKFLNSKKYKIFKTVSDNYSRETNLSWEQAQSLKKQKIHGLVIDYSSRDISKFFQICSEAESSLPQEQGALLYCGLVYFFDALSTKQTLFVQAVTLYLQNNTPGHLDPSEIIQQLFACLSVSDVWAQIEAADYDDKSLWEATFYAELPADKINQSYFNQLLTFYSDPHNYPSRSQSRIYFLDKYKKIDSAIYPIFYKQILKNYEANPRGTANILGAVFNSVHLANSSIDTVINNFINDINILETTYLKCLDQSNQNSLFDYEGRFFIKLVQTDSRFLDRFLNHISNIEKQRNGLLITIEKYFDHFSLIWGLPDYHHYMDKVCRWIFNIFKDRFQRGYILNLVFAKENNASKILQEKQIKFVRKSLDQHRNDKEKEFLLFLFSLTEIFPSQDRINLIMEFEQKNSNFNIFSQMPLQRMSFSGTSDQIISQRLASVTFLKNLEARMNGIDFLKHKKFIEQLINAQKRKIDAEDLKEFIEN